MTSPDLGNSPNPVRDVTTMLILSTSLTLAPGSQQDESDKDDLANWAASSLSALGPMAPAMIGEAKSRIRSVLPQVPPKVTPHLRLVLIAAVFLLSLQTLSLPPVAKMALRLLWQELKHSSLGAVMEEAEKIQVLCN